MTMTSADAAPWFTSSFSNGNATCVEVRFRGQQVDVRDSKDRLGPVLTVEATHWVEFVAGGSEVLIAEQVDEGWTIRPALGSGLLRFTDAEWRAYRAGANAGEFDPPGVEVCTPR